MTDSEDEAIGSEAAYWLAAMRGPDADARRAEFEAWKASDPRHASAYAHVEALFALAGSATRASSGRGTIADDRSPRRTGVTPPWSWRPLGIAAAFAALIAVGAITYTRFAPLPAPQLAHGVKDSAPQLRRLGDGSLVLLGAATLVTADLSDAVRQIRLDAGRARFIVAADAGRTFTVIARGQTIQASDGIFDVALVGDGLDVTARRGTVTVGARPGEPPRAIEPGSAVHVGVDGVQSVPSATPGPPGDWPPARLEFDGAPLGDVVALANSFGGTPIAVATPALARLRLTGTFDIRDTAALARKLAAAFDLEAADVAGKVVLAHRR